MAKRRHPKYLTIEEKRQLAFEGKRIPVCFYPNEMKSKTEEMEKKKLFNRFSRNL